MGRLYRHRDQADPAIDYYSQSLEAARASGDKALEGACLRALGVTQIELKRDTEQGLSYIRDQALGVLQPAEGDQVRLEEIYTRNYLAKYYAYVKVDRSRAKEFAQSALLVRDKLSKETREKAHGHSYAAAILIDVYEKEGAASEAYELLKRERDNLEIDLPSELGRVARMMMERGSCEEAKRLFEDALDAYRSGRKLRRLCLDPEVSRRLGPLSERS